MLEKEDLKRVKRNVEILFVVLFVFCSCLCILIQNAKNEAAKQAEQDQAKQDTTAKVKPPIASIKGDTIVFDLERIGELDRVDTLILEGIEALEERLNNELEIK